MTFSLLWIFIFLYFDAKYFHIVAFFNKSSLHKHSSLPHRPFHCKVQAKQLKTMHISTERQRDITLAQSKYKTDLRLWKTNPDPRDQMDLWLENGSCSRISYCLGWCWLAVARASMQQCDSAGSEGCSSLPISQWAELVHTPPTVSSSPACDGSIWVCESDQREAADVHTHSLSIWRLSCFLKITCKDAYKMEIP